MNYSKDVNQINKIIGFVILLLSHQLLYTQVVTASSKGIGGGGALFSPVINPYNTEQVFMACDMTQLFYSNNNGMSWDFYPFQKFVAHGNSEVQFTSDASIYYCTKMAFREDQFIPVISNDAGLNWTPINDPTNGFAYFLFADPHFTQRLCIGSESKLYYSMDGGENYTLIYSAAAERLYVAGVFWQNENIFIGTNNGLLFSIDGGETFNFFTNDGLPAATAFTSFTGAFADGVTKLVGVVAKKSDLYYSNEAWAFENYEGIFTLNFGDDASWINNSPDDGNFFFLCAMQETNTQIIYAGGTNSVTNHVQLFKSDDGGSSWYNTFKTENNENIKAGWCGDGAENNWWYAEVPFGLSVAQTDVNHVVFTDYGFVHISNDGGDSWRQAYVTAETQNEPGVLIPNNKAYAGTFENTSCWSILRTNEATLLGSFSDISGISSDNNGEDWSFKRVDDSYNTNYLIVADTVQNYLYAATSSVHDLYQSTRINNDNIGNGTGEILVSTNEGISWETLHNFNDPVVWLAQDPTNINVMYASVVRETAGGIYKTENATSLESSTWVKLAEPPRTQDHPFCVVVLNDGSIVCSFSANKTATFSESSGLFYSEDGGTTWMDKSDPNFYFWTKDIVIDPHDASENTWYACIFTHWGLGAESQGGIYRTTNRGATWVKIESFFRCESITINPNNANEAYATTEDEGLWKTNNLTDPDPLFLQVEAYQFQHPVRTFYDKIDPTLVWVTSFGNGITTLKNEDEIEIEFPLEIATITIFPNPSSESITVTSDALMSQIKIISITGQIVFSQYLNTTIQVIPIKEMEQGIYIIQITTEQGISIQKICIE